MNTLPLVMIRGSDLRDSHDAIQAARSGQRLWAKATTVPAIKIAQAVDLSALESSDPGRIRFKSGQRVGVCNTADTSWFGWMVRFPVPKRDISPSPGGACREAISSAGLRGSRCKLFGHEMLECGRSFSTRPSVEAGLGRRESRTPNLLYSCGNQRRLRKFAFSISGTAGGDGTAVSQVCRPCRCRK